MTPFRSKEEQAAAMSKRKAPAAGPHRVPLGKAGKGKTIHPALLEEHLGGVRADDHSRAKDAMLATALAELGRVPRQQLRRQDGTLAAHLADVLSRSGGEWDLVLGAQLVAAAQRADRLQSVRDASSRPSLPSAAHQAGYDSVIRGMTGWLELGLGMERAVKENRAGHDLDYRRSGCNDLTSFEAGARLAYEAIHRAFMEAR